MDNSTPKIIRLFKAFSLTEPELTASEIWQRTKIPISTLYRLLNNLKEERWLEKNSRTERYCIGDALYMVGNLYTSSTGLVRASEPIIKVVNELTNEAVSIVVRDKKNVAIILREESKFSIRWAVHVGSIMAAHASSPGKVFLSELSEKELDTLYAEERLPSVTKKTIGTKAELKIELEKIRRTGIAVHSEESIAGVWGVASLIRDNTGTPIASLSVAVPLFRINADTSELIADMVKVASSIVSYRLGYTKINHAVRNVEELRSWWKQRTKNMKIEEVR